MRRCGSQKFSLKVMKCFMFTKVYVDMKARMRVLFKAQEAGHVLSVFPKVSITQRVVRLGNYTAMESRRHIRTTRRERTEMD